MDKSPGMGINLRVWYCTVTEVAAWPSAPVTEEYETITGKAEQVVTLAPTLAEMRSSSRARLQVLVSLVVLLAVCDASVDVYRAMVRAALAVELSAWAKKPQSKAPMNRKMYHGRSKAISTALLPRQLFRRE